MLAAPGFGLTASEHTRGEGEPISLKEELI